MIYPLSRVISSLTLHLSSGSILGLHQFLAGTFTFWGGVGECLVTSEDPSIFKIKTYCPTKSSKMKFQNLIHTI